MHGGAKAVRPHDHLLALVDQSRILENAYANQTTIHPVALVSLLCLCLATVLLPRRFALIPTLVLICFVPAAQRIVIVGLDFTLLRIIAFVGCGRVFARREFHMGRWRSPDTVIVAWAAVSVAAYSLLHASFSDFVYIVGSTTEALSLYFLVRGLLRSWGDLRTFAVAVVAICSVVALGFINEKITGRNVFSVFGGVPEFTAIRQGRLRCQGAFPHPILAGCFWAVMTSYAVSLWWSRLALGRLMAVIALAGAMAIIVACASSTPLAGIMAGAAGACWFLFRHQTKLLRYGVVILLVSLHMVMEAPVWHLISRLDLAGGSTGEHRYRLIDAAVTRFPEWAALGAQTTGHWGFFLFDLANQYIYEGVRGGVLRLILFSALIAMCFKRVGILCTVAGANRERLAQAWGLGVGLFIHCTCFFGVSYYGQVTFGWYFSLAAIVSLAEPYDRASVQSAHLARSVPPLARRLRRGARRRLQRKSLV